MRTLLLLALAASIGCTPRTIVRQNPGPNDTGIRYYRPKPYLVVQPHPAIETSGTRLDKYVDVSLAYLPDFSEEYSIHVRSGLGTNKTSVKLADGWNLTEINQDLDSQFDENVKAVADLLEAAAPGGIIPTDVNKHKSPTMTVAATNVPIGYYESVIARGPDCKKRLYGWRYVGFYPYQACPLSAGGMECVDCQSAAIYGLVFRKGVMTFEPIHAIGMRQAEDIKQTLSAPLEPLPPPGA